MYRRVYRSGTSGGGGLVVCVKNKGPAPRR